jgi:hypothetical protein
MCGDEGVHKDLSNLLEPDQSAFLVGPHEATIPGHIRRQHSREPSLYPRLAQKNPPDGCYWSQTPKHMREPLY